MPEDPADRDLETRVTGLERTVGHLSEEVALARTDAGAARVLAGGADRDVSEVRAELRAHNRVLVALRQTQLEQGENLTGLRTEMNERFAQVDERFAQVDERFAQVDERFAQVDERFAQVDANFAQVNANFDTVNEKLAVVHAGIAQIVGLLGGSAGQG